MVQIEPMKRDTCTGFLSLPSETRHQIYSDLLASKLIILRPLEHWTKNTRHPTKEDSRQFSLLRVSRQLRHEFLHTVDFSDTTFVLSDSLYPYEPTRIDPTAFWIPDRSTLASSDPRSALTATYTLPNAISSQLQRLVLPQHLYPSFFLVALGDMTEPWKVRAIPSLQKIMLYDSWEIISYEPELWTEIHCWSILQGSYFQDRPVFQGADCFLPDIEYYFQVRFSDIVRPTGSRATYSKHIVEMRKLVRPEKGHWVLVTSYEETDCTKENDEKWANAFRNV